MEPFNHKDRLTVPLRRTAPKGAANPGWQPIAWDEALDEIARRVREMKTEHGPEQVAFSVVASIHIRGLPLEHALQHIQHRRLTLHLAGEVLFLRDQLQRISTAVEWAQAGKPFALIPPSPHEDHSRHDPSSRS